MEFIKNKGSNVQHMLQVLVTVSSILKWKLLKFWITHVHTFKSILL